MRTLVIGGSGFLGRTFTELDDVLATHHRHEQPYAPIEFNFWTDDPSSLIDRYRPDAVVFAATVEYHNHDIPRATFAATAERFVLCDPHSEGQLDGWRQQACRRHACPRSRKYRC